MYDEVIYLITESTTTNDIGDIIHTPTNRQIFAKVKSIGQNEFYQAQSEGFKPELKFVISDYLDYNNEKKLTYNSVNYDIIRTFRNNDELEITCSRGVNNANS